jgi:hypothetical protein
VSGGGFARSTCAGSLAIVAAAYLAGLVWMPDGGFWINDNGLKFIQVQGILRNGFESFAIDWPGFAIDPSYDFGPIAKPFMHFVERELYISYSPVFALFSALPFRLFGPIGLLLLPLAAGLIALPAVRRLAQLASGDATARVGSVAVLLAGLATPLWFYSQTFWEHTPALALSCWSFVACLRYREQPTCRRAVATAVLAALPGPWQRLVVAGSGCSLRALCTLRAAAARSPVTAGGACGRGSRAGIGGGGAHGTLACAASDELADALERSFRSFTHLHPRTPTPIWRAAFAAARLAAADAEGTARNRRRVRRDLRVVRPCGEHHRHSLGQSLPAAGLPRPGGAGVGLVGGVVGAMEGPLCAAEIVITDTWFLPADLAHSFYEKPIFLARRSIDRRRLEAAAGSAGVERALLVERLRRGQAAPGGRLLSDGWLNFSSVVLRERALTADGPG